MLVTAGSSWSTEIPPATGRAETARPAKARTSRFPIDHVDTIRTERTDPGDGLREVERLGNGDEHGAA